MSEKQKNTSTPQDETRSALSRLLVVLVVAIGLFIYAYGWTVTEIDLTEPQEEQRQESVTRALRELLSPRLFEQERELTQYEASFLMDCTTGDAPEQALANSNEIVVILEPACADANEVISLRLLNGPVGADARLRWVPPADENGEIGNVRPLEIIETGREDLVLDAAGGFEGTVEVPRIRQGEGEIHTLRVLVAIPNGPIEFSETALLVIDRMIQTIFMALVATTVAIPIAALISFFAAHNLMRRVRLTVGSMLMAFILFIMGTWIGATFITIIGEWGLMVGRGELFAPIGALLAFVVPVLVIVATMWVLAQLQSDTDGKRSPQTNSMMQILNTVISSLVVIFIIGAIGGLGILGGEQISLLAESIRPDEVVGISATIQDGVGVAIGSIGNLLLILSELVELGIAPIAGAVTGFALAGIGASVLGNQMRSLRGPISHVLAAIMGAISGGILLTLLSTVALWASLLAILPLLVGAMLGGQVLRQILGIAFDRNATPVDGIIIKSGMRRFAEWLIFWVGFVIIFVWMFNAMNVGRSFVDGTLPPQTMARIFGIELPITVYVYTAMLFGAILAGISGALTGLHGVFPLGNLLYNTSRTLLNVVRSIEPLIMGLVFVIWVGIGPFAGVLALTLHSIAALGKLYSEQIENIDPGPIEALESTGANQLQTIIYAVVPQIVPPYIAFTMYRWDINVRMSTIIGFVGGGGIGLLLNQQINLLRYRDAGVAVLAIAVVVSVLDYASAYIRERVL